jgi:hypothetical protein
MKLFFMCSCGNLPKSPFLQSHLELSSLCLSAFGTTILLCFQLCIKKNHELLGQQFYYVFKFVLKKHELLGQQFYYVFKFV